METIKTIALGSFMLVLCASMIFFSGCALVCLILNQAVLAMISISMLFISMWSLYKITGMGENENETYL